MADVATNLYRGFRHVSQINSAYNPSLNHPQAQAYLEQYVVRSQQTRARLQNHSGLRYGKHPRATLDFFPAAARCAPLQVFIHGGYWRSLSSDTFSFMADAWVATGHHVAILNYPLLPEVTLPEQIAAVRAAMVWLWQQADALQIDRSHIRLAGHSAGGHLVACCLTTDWATLGLPQHPWERALCLSGLFDLAPFPHSWLQPDLHLSNCDVAECSPVFQPVHTGCMTCTAVGAQESSEFERQGLLWQSRLRQHQPSYTHLFKRIAHHDHFTILDEIALGTGATFEFLVSNS